MALYITEDMISEYIEALPSQGKGKDTITNYKYNLMHMYRLLPGDKKVEQGTVEEIRRGMLDDGYAANTVNSFTAAVNSFFAFCGFKEYQVLDTLKVRKGIRDALTETEYLRLLSAAKGQGKERLYLMIKLMACTGIMMSRLDSVTVEAAEAGKINTHGKTIHIPPALCGQLLEYTDKHGIHTGRIFLTRNGNKIDRSNLNREIKALAQDARVPEEKCTPTALRKMYQEQVRGIYETAAEQAGNRFAAGIRKEKNQ